MVNKKWLSSLWVLLIGLITPFLVWVLLYTVAQNKPQAFDPNPIVHDLVTAPRTFIQNDRQNPWVHLIGKNSVWNIKEKDGSLSDLEKLAEKLPPDGQRLVLLLEAQGPTLAMSLYHYLKDHELLKKVIFLSASDGILKDVRFHDGTLTTGAGQAFVIRFHALQRLKLQGLITIDMSAIWLDKKIFAKDLVELANYFHSKNVAVFTNDVEAVKNTLEKKANLLLE